MTQRRAIFITGGASGINHAWNGHWEEAASSALTAAVGRIGPGMLRRLGSMNSVSISAIKSEISADALNAAIAVSGGHCKK